jgi:UPF0716 protein FxsA
MLIFLFNHGFKQICVTMLVFENLKVSMRFLLLLTALSLPILDLVVSAKFAEWLGISVWWMIAMGVIAGFGLLSHERLRFRSKTLAALHASSLHGAPAVMGSLLDSGRKLVAGFLFLMPGIISDGVAFILLLLPIRQSAHVATSNGVIDGQYRRID